MRIVTTSYINTSEFNDPLAWLDRISFHTGILQELAKHHEVNSIEQINYSGQLMRNNVNYHFVNYKKSKTYFPIRLHNYIKNLKPDVVWIHGFIFPFQLIQLKWQLGNDIKIIVQNHAEKPYSGWRKMLQQLADRYVHSYFFASAEMGAQWLRKNIISDEKKIVEIMEASSVFLYQDIAEMNSPDHPVFLWVGRLDSNKDPVTVVKAFLEFIKNQPYAKLYMIYHTTELLKQIEVLIADAPENIKLIGRMPHSQLQTWYNKADFIISGSYYEGSGIAVCEGMSCGCIPIVTNIPSFRKMTGNEACGLLYHAGNQKELLYALLHTKKMNLQLEKKKTIEQFNLELSFEAIARKMNEILDTIDTNA